MKRWVSFDFDAISPNKVQRKSSTITKHKSELKPTYIKKKGFNFEKAIIPRDCKDLAVNKNRIDLVRQWLTDFVIKSTNQASTPILVITGPTGSGKTVTLNLICKELKIEVLEWINPSKFSYDFEIDSGQIAKFLDFMRDSKYPSLETFNDKKIILIEDFPNVFLNDYKLFHATLDDIVNSTSTPFVFLCTETNNIKTNLYQNLFPEDIQLKYHISTISFITASVTLLKNALKRVQSIIEERQDIFTVPAVNLLEAIANSSMGDIRCAINNYHLAALNGASSIETFEKKNKKRKRTDISVTATMLRDDNLGIFHLLGRILNPKRKEYKNSWRIDCNIEETVEEFMTYPVTGLNLLKCNYLKYFNDFDEVCKASDVLSQTQLFMGSSYEQYDLQKLGLFYCTLGMMLANEHKASKWNQIKAPKRDENNLDLKNDLENLDPLDGCYYDLIHKTNKFYRFLW